MLRNRYPDTTECWWCLRPVRFFCASVGGRGTCSICELWFIRNKQCQIADKICHAARHRNNIAWNRSIPIRMPVFLDHVIWNLVLEMLAGTKRRLCFEARGRVWRQLVLGKHRNTWIAEISDSDSEREGPGQSHEYFGTRRWSDPSNRRRLPLWMVFDLRSKSLRHHGYQTVGHLIFTFVGKPPSTASEARRRW